MSSNAGHEGARVTTRRTLLMLLAAGIVAARPGRVVAADAATVVKVGRFRYGDDLVDIRFEVHAADMSDDGAMIEPTVTRSHRGTVKAVQGRLERKSIGDSFRALRVQDADGTWHDINIWVPVRLENP
jgi:hypothetical protein